MTVASWTGDQSNGTGAYENGVHEALLADPSKLTHPIKEVADKYELLPAFLKVCATVFAVKEYACTHRITCMYEISATTCSSLFGAASRHGAHSAGARTGEAAYRLL